MDDDPLADLRTAYLAVSQESVDATLDAASIQREPPSSDQSERFLTALHRMVGLQVQVLAALDRIVLRADRLGAEQEVIAEFRNGRADLALGLQRTLAQLERLEAL